MISKFFIYTKNLDYLSSRLFTKPIHKSTLVEQNQMQLRFFMITDKGSYVVKEDWIHLLSVAKKAALNEQQITLY